MKGILAIAVAVLATSFCANAQMMDDMAITTAVSAAPANLRDGATVIKWNTGDFTYTTLRKGTNKIVCYDRSGFPEQQAFSIECTSLGNVDRVAQNLKAEALGDKAKSAAMLDAEEKDGTRIKPEFGSVWYHLMGPDKATAHPHMTIAVPGATAMSLGLPDNPKTGGVWIMNAGTSTAHLMTPGE
jgi:hypothetical protein